MTYKQFQLDHKYMTLNGEIVTFKGNAVIDNIAVAVFRNIVDHHYVGEIQICNGIELFVVKGFIFIQADDEVKNES